MWQIGSVGVLNFHGSDSGFDGSDLALSMLKTACVMLLVQLPGRHNKATASSLQCFLFK